MELKIRFHHLNSCQTLKKYFNNKSLIVYANDVLLDFFVYVSQLHFTAHTNKSINIFIIYADIHHQIRLTLSLH